MPAPTITPLPTPPSRSTDPTNFAIEADAFVAALPEFATDANAQATYLDGLATAVDADAAIAEAAASIATGAANYKGDYSAGTTYQIGQSVSYSSRRYVAKTVNTGVTPVDGANWLVINDGDVSGPASATANGVALYDGTTGKIIKAGPAPSTAGNLLTSNGTTWVSSAPPSSAVNYPQNIQSANYTLVLSDAGKQIFHPASDTAIRTYTIPANSVVAFPIGTVVLFTAENGAFPITVAITTDTLVGGDGTTGSISVPANNTLMAIKVTATKWMANYLYQATISGRIQAAFTEQSSTTTNAPVYTWTDASGFGSKYADPSTAIPLYGYGVAFAPSGSTIATTSSGTPYISAYAWSYAGFGAKFANPATLPTGAGNGVTFSPAGNAIAVAHDGTPYVTAYPWSASGFGVKYANPTTLPSFNGIDVAFSPDGNSIAVGHVNSPNVTAYPWNSTTGFGTKFTNPATLPTSNGQRLAFSPAGDALAVAHSSSPFATVYPWNSSTGFGTKFANPATAISANVGYSVAFHPTGNAIVVGLDQDVQAATAYAWSSSGWGARLATYYPPSSGTFNARDIAFSPSGNAIMLAGYNSTTASGEIRAYRWTSTGFGAIYSSWPTLTGYSYGAAFNTSF